LRCQVVESLHRCEKALEALGEEETKLLLIARSQQRKLRAVAAASTRSAKESPVRVRPRPKSGERNKKERRGRERIKATPAPVEIDRTEVLRAQLEQAARALQAAPPFPPPATPPMPPAVAASMTFPLTVCADRQRTVPFVHDESPQSAGAASAARK
jgi:hypothetical protein